MRKLSKYAPRKRLLDHSTYIHYKESNIPKSFRVESYSEFLKISRALLHEASKMITDSVGGLVLDKIGYFGHWRLPRKRIFKRPFNGGAKLMTNVHSDRYFYVTQFMPNVFKTNRFKGWSLCRSYNSKRIKNRRFTRLKEGMRYKFYFTLLKNMYKNKK